MPMHLSLNRARPRPSATGISPARDRIARVLMILLGIASVGAFANAAHDFGSIAPERINVETWRMFAFLVFAGLFTLLGLFPRRMPGLWELVLFQKSAVTIFLTVIVPPHAESAQLADHASSIAGVDAILVITTLASYILTRGWRAWSLATRE